MVKIFELFIDKSGSFHFYLRENPLLARYSDIFNFLQFCFKLKLWLKVWGEAKIFQRRIFSRNAIKNGGNVVGVKN